MSSMRPLVPVGSPRGADAGRVGGARRFRERAGRRRHDGRRGRPRRRSRPAVAAVGGAISARPDRPGRSACGPVRSRCRSRSSCPTLGVAASVLGVGLTAEQRDGRAHRACGQPGVAAGVLVPRAVRCRGRAAPRSSPATSTAPRAHPPSSATSTRCSPVTRSSSATRRTGVGDPVLGHRVEDVSARRRELVGGADPDLRRRARRRHPSPALGRRPRSPDSDHLCRDVQERHPRPSARRLRDAHHRTTWDCGKRLSGSSHQPKRAAESRARSCPCAPCPRRARHERWWSLTVNTGHSIRSLTWASSL